MTLRFLGKDPDSPDGGSPTDRVPRRGDSYVHPAVADAQTLNGLLLSCQHSALHVEMRDGYMLDDPMLHRWRDGHRDDPADRAWWWRPWLQLMSETTARGVDVRRARIVSEPVSEHIRFEYDITFTNLAASEQVRATPHEAYTPTRSRVRAHPNDHIFDGTCANGYCEQEGHPNCCFARARTHAPPMSIRS